MVCELLMPLVIKTDMYKRWELARPTAASRTDDEHSSVMEAEDDGKRAEEQLLREVLADRQPMAEWNDEQKEAMIRYTLQLQARARGSGGSGEAGGAESEEIRLSELMQACMSMYQSLVTTQHQSVHTRAHSARADTAAPAHCSSTDLSCPPAGGYAFL